MTGFIRCYNYECDYNQLKQQKGLLTFLKSKSKEYENEGHLWGFCMRHAKGEKMTISKSKYCCSGNP